MRNLRWLVLTAFLLAFIGGASAQVSKTAGALEGSITDTTGAAVAGAQCTLHDPSTGRERRWQSSPEGMFQVSQVAVGEYELRVEAPGFTTQVQRGILIGVGQTVHVTVVLRPSGEQREMTVTSAPPPLDTSEAAVKTAIDTERVEELPVRSRNYLNFVLLAPGVTEAPAATSAAAPATASGFSFGGLRPRSNSLSIDGVENNDEYTGGSRTELSLETVREFQVVNQGLSAESGGAAGGAINVVTKSGANIHHGDAFVFLQNGAPNARPALLETPGKPDLTRYRVGGAVGGPIRRDRIFFYTAAEQEHTRSQAESEIGPGAAAAINAALAAGGLRALRGKQLTTGTFPTALAETEASGKIDDQLSANHALMVRYAFTNNRDAGDAFNTGAFADRSARGAAFTADHALVASLASVLSSQAVNDLRGQVATRRVALRSGDSVGPGVEIAGVADFGRPYAGDSFRRENHYDLADTFSWARGHHLLKAGAAVDRTSLRAQIGDGFGGLFTFADLNAFLAGAPDQYRQAFGNQRTDFAVTAASAFLNEHWSAMRRLSFDVGLRYDFESLPAGLREGTRNFSPRIGLVWAPAEGWAVRAGYGVFFDRYVLAAVNRVLQKNVVGAREYVFGSGAAAALLAQGAPLNAGEPLGAPPSVYRAASNLATPYSQQASAGVEHLLAKNWTASATYQLVRGVKLARTVNVNLAPPVVLTPANAPLLNVPFPTPQQLGRPVFPPGRPDPLHGAIYEWQNQASSTYNGLSLALTRRMSNEIEFSGAYTWSKTIDDASDFDEQPQNPYALLAERAPSRYDQRHGFVFSGLFDLPFGDEDEPGGAKGGKLAAVLGNIELAPIVSVHSGRPVNPLTGVDSIHNLSFPLSVRPLGFARNSLRTPATASVDLRILKFFKVSEHGKLDLVAEAFNLLNRRNVTEISPFYGVSALPMATFRQPLEASNARQVQFSLDFEF